MTLITVACSSALADCYCGKLELIEKSTYERPAKIGLLGNEDSHTEIIEAYGISRSPDKQIRIFITKEHGYGGGSYEIIATKHVNDGIALKLKFFSDLFSIGTAATNHRLLFFISDKSCNIREVYILGN